MSHHFTPPHITGARTLGEWLTALELWKAFRALREAGQND